MKQAIYTLCGHTFGLSAIREGIKVFDFTARLTCDGNVLASVTNDGKGGLTSFSPYPGVDMDLYGKLLEEVRKEVWLTDEDGTKYYHDFGTIAIECYLGVLKTD